MRGGVDRPVKTQLPEYSNGEPPDESDKSMQQKSTSQQRRWIEEARKKPYISVQVMQEGEVG